MKKYLYITALLNLIITSCSGFLDEADKDLLVPTKTEHFQALMLSEFNQDFGGFNAIEFMTDDIEEYSYSLESQRKISKTVYTWQREIELDDKNKPLTNNGAWVNFYKKIAIMNYIIEMVDDMGCDSAAEYYVKAEAHFYRAYCYFLLNNLYGVPFNNTSAERDLGVPLRLDNGIVQTYQRTTVANVYRQIEKDLLDAKRLFLESNIVKGKFHPSATACDLLLSRTYLYTENWDKTIAHATHVIKQTSLSLINTLKPFVTDDREELLFSFGQQFLLNSDTYNRGWKVSDELISLYAEKDLRLTAFFDRIPGMLEKVYYSRKNNKGYTAMGALSMRAAEAYLNRAEAYVRKNEPDKAIADVTELLKKRHLKESDIDLSYTSDPLQLVLTERRKELCHDEYHRWFDLRRMKERPLIIHRYTLTDDSGNKMGIEKYALLPNDKNYTLPIPIAERNNNPLIHNNERLEKIAQTEDDL